jgi:hypothetical protein
MIEIVAKGVLHLMNWIAALFVLAITCPQYEQIAGMITLPLAIMALGCAFLVATLSLAQKEGVHVR